MLCSCALGGLCSALVGRRVEALLTVKDELVTDEQIEIDQKKASSSNVCSRPRLCSELRLRA